MVLFSSLAMVSWKASGSAGVDSRTGGFDLQKKVLSTPNAYIFRTVYPDFVHRFIIIKPKEVHTAAPDLNNNKNNDKLINNNDDNNNNNNK